MIPRTESDLFTQIAFYAFQATLLVVFLSWLLKHLLHVLQDVILDLRKFSAAVRRDLPPAPEKVVSSPP